jgi:hypothetical protein
MAAWIADRALSNNTKKESPWVLCSVPPFAANARAAARDGAP